MGPTGAICGPRVASRPLSQSRSLGSCEVSSWAQANSAASERIRMFFGMRTPPGSRKQKSRLVSSERKLGQGGSGDRVEQRAAVIGRIDGPGDLQHGARTLAPGLLQVREETGGSRQRLVAPRRTPRTAVGGLEPQRSA